MLLHADIIFYVGFVHHLIFNEALHFRSWLCFPFQARKAPNLVDPLDGTVLSHWARF